MNDMQRYYERLDRALAEMDLAALRSILIEKGSTSIDGLALVVAVHKVRLERTTIDPKLRLESVEWLRDNGFTRRGGLPLPPPGVLPT
jgi:hypothetical protein